MHTGFWWENLKEKDSLEDLRVGYRTILNWAFKIGCDFVDLIHLTHNSDSSRLL
jgi:hypothetical protein